MRNIFATFALFLLVSGCTGFYQPKFAPLTDRTGNMETYLADTSKTIVAFGELWEQVGDTAEPENVGPDLWVQCNIISIQYLDDHIKARTDRMMDVLHKKFRGDIFSTWAFYAHTYIGGKEQVCVFVKVERYAEPPITNSGE